MKKILLGAATLMVTFALSAQAQIDVPNLTRWGSTDSTIAITAGEATENIRDLWGRAEGQLPITEGTFPRDSVRKAASAQARRWLVRLARLSVKGTQREPYSKILSDGDEDSLSKRVIAERLATPGLTPEERSYAYLAAVQAFADPSVPTRLTIAERYLAHLNAMGAPAAYHRFLAELVMVKTYDEMGRNADVARHGVAAVRILPSMSVADQDHAGGIYDPLQSPFPTIIRAVSVQPNGKAVESDLRNMMASTLKPSPDSVKLDSNFYFATQRLNGDYLRMVNGLNLVGTMGAPVYANRWLNRSDSTPGSMSVTDGRVHVLLTANYGCGICVFAAIQLQKIVDADPNMQAVLITWTDNMWGSHPESPDSNAAHLTNFWVNEKGIHYPIALWIAHKTDLLADSSIVEDLADDSTLQHYPESGKPQFYILDKQGRIRSSFFTFDRVVMRQIVEIVHSLEVEPAKGATKLAASE